MKKSKTESEDPRFYRQQTIAMYGHGPYNPTEGLPMGCADLGVLRLVEGYCIVQTDYLDALEALVKVQKTRIEQLEKLPKAIEALGDCVG